MAERRSPNDQEHHVVIDPETHPSYLLAKVSHQLGLTIGRALAAHGVTLTQFSALAHISRSPGLSGADLGRALLTTPQASATLVRRLVDAGLVERTAVSAGLASSLRLTVLGVHKLRSAEPVATQAEEIALATLPMAEQRKFLAMVSHLATALDKSSTGD